MNNLINQTAGRLIRRLTLNVLNSSCFTLVIKNIAAVEMWLLRYAAHNKMVSPAASNVPSLHSVRQRAGAIMLLRNAFYITGGMTD